MNSYYVTVLKDIVRLFSEQNAGAKENLQTASEDSSAALQPKPAVQEEKTADTGAEQIASLKRLTEGNYFHKVKAVSRMLDMDLGSCLCEVQKLLDAADLEQEYKGELIEAMVEQQIDAPFHMMKDGQSIEFNPIQILPREKDSGYQQASQLIETWLENSHPALAPFCQDMLEQELLEIRPQSFGERDPEALAAALVQLVFEAMQDEAGWQAVQQAYDLENAGSYKLRIKERGE